MGSPNLTPVGMTLADLRRAVQKLASLRLNADSTPSFLQNAISGTTNQIIITVNSDNSITLSLPQDIDTSADIQFGSADITNTATVGRLLAGGVTE